MSISLQIEELLIARNTIRTKMMAAGQANRNDKLLTLATNLDLSGAGIDTSNATATPETILNGYTAYVNGEKITGVNNYDADTSDADATASDILSGKTAYVNGSKITGTSTFDADTSDADATAANIDKDKTAYVNGEKITGTSTKTDTSDADATADDILTGKTAYVKGSKVTGTATARIDTSDADAVASNILKDKTAYVDGKKVTGTMTNRGAWTSSVARNSSTTIPAGYHNGNGYISGPSITTRTASSETITSAKTYYSGYYGSSWTVTPGGTDTSDATATASDILSGKTAYVNGSKVTGDIVTRGAVDQTIINARTYNAGYYPNSWTITPPQNMGYTSYTIWTNPNLNTNFDAQKIDLSSEVKEKLAKYDIAAGVHYYRIHYYVIYANGDIAGTWQDLPEYSSCYLVDCISTRIAYRRVGNYLGDGKGIISFSNNTVLYSNSAADQTNNSFTIPIKIDLNVVIANT